MHVFAAFRISIESMNGITNQMCFIKSLSRINPLKTQFLFSGSSLIEFYAFTNPFIITNTIYVVQCSRLYWLQW